MKKIVQRNSTVAIISLSWGGPAAFPHIFNKGIENIRKFLGLNVKMYPTTLMKEGEARPEEKVRDLIDALQDPRIACVISSIGGNHAISLLPLLDSYDLRPYAKPILGFSDTSILLSYLQAQGYCAIHGPSVMAGFAQLHNLPTRYVELMREVLFGTKERIRLPVFKNYYEGYPEWSKIENTGKLVHGRGNWPRIDGLNSASIGSEHISTSASGRNSENINTRTTNGKGFEILQLGRPVTAHLWGGCIESLEQLKDTDYWPPPDFFRGTALIFETSEWRPSPALVAQFLEDYGARGILSNISGILWGIPYRYNTDDAGALKDSILNIVVGRYSRSDIPILFNVNIGHCDPNPLIPLNWRVRIHRDITLIRPSG